MKQVIVPSVEQIILLNKLVCEKAGNPHHCYSAGKVESALHSAFYPGDYPFAHGGIVKTAGALCFYLVQSHAFLDGNKRTGALAAITFLNQNGWTLNYPRESKSNPNALAEMIERCAAGSVSKDELIEWFDRHKVQRSV
jgi:death on curing protein